MPMKPNLVRAGWTFLCAYLIVSILAPAITVAYAIIARTPPVADANVSILLDPAFVATVPAHVAIMLVIWPAFAAIYFRPSAGNPTALHITALSLIWLVLSMAFDYGLFVAIRHPWSLSPREFYVLYQPWISLIYLAIVVSPWIYAGIRKSRKVAVQRPR